MDCVRTLKVPREARSLRRFAGDQVPLSAIWNDVWHACQACCCFNTKEFHTLDRGFPNNRQQWQRARDVSARPIAHRQQQVLLIETVYFNADPTWVLHGKTVLVWS